MSLLYSKHHQFRPQSRCWLQPYKTLPYSNIHTSITVNELVLIEAHF